MASTYGVSGGSGTSYLSYQAPIRGHDSSGVPLVDIGRASQISQTNLQNVYSSAYTQSGGSRYEAQQAVTSHLSSMGVNGNTVNWG